MRLHIPVRSLMQKNNHKEMEQQAEMNLIEISDLGFEHT